MNRIESTPTSEENKMLHTLISEYKKASGSFDRGSLAVRIADTLAAAPSILDLHSIEDEIISADLPPGYRMDKLTAELAEVVRLSNEATDGHLRGLAFLFDDNIEYDESWCVCTENSNLTGAEASKQDALFFAGAVNFIRTHHATIQQNAIDAARYKAAFERCDAVCKATAEGWNEDAKKLAALERVMGESDKRKWDDHELQWVHPRAAEIMKSEMKSKNSELSESVKSDEVSCLSSSLHLDSDDKMTLILIQSALKEYVTYQATGGYDGKLLGNEQIIKMIDSIEAII